MEKCVTDITEIPARLDNAVTAHPGLRRAIIYSDRGAQYTSEIYRKAMIWDRSEHEQRRRLLPR